MRDSSDRYKVQNIVNLSSSNKKIGSYLVDAGLLSTDQISVVLNDQQATGMRFGEIVVARGWVKEQTVEWIMTKVVEPDRHQAQPVPQPQPQMSGRWAENVPPARSSVQPAAKPLVARSMDAQPVAGKATGARSLGQNGGSSRAPESGTAASSNPTGSKAFARREAPISKSLPSVNSSDGDVNWVG